MESIVAIPISWPWWRKLLFRFCCIYLLLYMAPLQWVGNLPLLGYVSEYYAKAENGLVTLTNTHLIHVKDVLIPLNGSGDTSYGYAQLVFFAGAALLGMLVWTWLDTKRRNYERGYYWLLVLVRYYVAMNALSYGIIKLFGQQMIFPSLSQLATPLGDFLPMRFSWLFIGYSTPYQFFSGAAEVVAGLFLLFRRTSTLGALVAAGVFMNVMMMNLCYDIPVKLFSIHLFALSNFLLAADARRLLNFFVFNRPTQPSLPLTLPKRWMRISQQVLKLAFVVVYGLMPLYQAYQFRREPTLPIPSNKRLTTGVFSVEEFSSAMPDSLRWKDVIFEKGPTGSIQTADTSLRQRYHRAYFGYELDTAKHQIKFKKFPSDSTFLFTLRYTQPDTNHIQLQGRIRADSVQIALKRQPRHFQLAERQFHWLSEANR